MTTAAQQVRMFYAASRQIADTNLMFLTLVEEGLTREELQRNIERRPGLWQRFEHWLPNLPSKNSAHGAIKTQLAVTVVVSEPLPLLALAG